MAKNKEPKTEIKLDPHNTRYHSDINKALIKKSLDELGAGRSALIDNDGYLIAGNGVFEQAKKLGIKPRIIETDGSELIVVKRTDLKYRDEVRRKMGIADNATTDLSEMIYEDLTPDELDEWLIEVPEVLIEEEIYTRKIIAPTYEPSDEKPNVKTLVNREKTSSLLAEIEKAKIPKDIKEFLKLSAYRHYEFNYERIADYYTHSDKEVQNLMEQSALVIIDFNDAIKYGFVGLTEKIAEMYKVDYND